MYRLGERPLTWLFVIATLCADATVPLYKPPTHRGFFEYLYLGVIIGQTWLAGAWLATGAPHRLLRATCFVGILAGLTTLVLLGDADPINVAYWGRIFGSVSVLAAVAALGAWLGHLVARSAFASRRSASTLRYPISELLGWMVVVAVGSWTVSVASFGHLASSLSSLLFAVTSSIIAGFVVALASERECGRLSKRVRAAILITVAFLVGYRFGTVDEKNLYYGANIGFVFLAIAIAVRTWDVARRPQPLIEEVEPQLTLSADED